MDIKNSNVMVIGGTGGVGRRVCMLYAKAGANVAVVYFKSKDTANEIVAEMAALGVEGVAIQADASKQEGIDKAVDETMNALGGIDILIHTGGKNKKVEFPDLEGLTEEVWDMIMDNCLKSPYLAIRKVAPIMKKQGRGRIVNVTSIAGMDPSGSSIAYAVSKAGQNHLSRCLAKALGPEILVNSVAPGMMAGVGMVKDFPQSAADGYAAGAALGRTTGADDVAQAIFDISKNDSITGETLVVDAGKIYN